MTGADSKADDADPKADVVWAGSSRPLYETSRRHSAAM